MVEKPRSRGCRICVQRRVKCDLTRPICVRCQKGHRPCPGYPADIQFHDEGAKLQVLFGPKRRTGAEDQYPEGPVEANNCQGTITIPSGSPSYENSERLNQQSLMKSATAVPTQPRLGNNHWTVDFGVCSPYIQQRQLFSLFTSAMSPANQQNPKLFRNFGDWLSMLATLQGTDSLLDSTFRAVSLAHLSLAHQDPSLMYESRKLYGRSLSLLAKALAEPTKGRSSETLSATVMLSYYEMFSSHHETSTGYDTWVRHAGGAGALMRIRGPKAHRRGMDRSMFLAYRNTLVIESFDTRKPCFLNEPEWRQLAVDLHQEIRQSIAMEKAREILDLSEGFFRELIKVPAVLSDAYNVVELTRAAGGKRYQVMDEIAARAKAHVSEVKAMYLRMEIALQNNQQAVQERTSVPNDPIFPTRYVWPNFFTATYHVGSWNTLMFMNMLLVNFDRDESHQQSYMMDNVHIARQVCRGADYLAQSSFLGPFFLTFALRIAIFSLDGSEERQWAGRKLMEIGEKLGMAKAPTTAEQALPVALRKEVEKLERLEGVTD